MITVEETVQPRMQNVPITGISNGAGEAKGVLARRHIKHVAGLCSDRTGFFSESFFIGLAWEPSRHGEKVLMLDLCKVGNTMTPITKKSKSKKLCNLFFCIFTYGKF
jgi:hypothetical protein